MELKWYTIETPKPPKEVGYDRGWGCGYVQIGPDHPLFWVDRDLLWNLDVHGGVTFDQYTAADVRTLGFDTSHLNDSLITWPKEVVEAEAARFAKVLEDFYEQTKHLKGLVWK